MFGTYDVVMNDGTHHEVTCDNRDFIAFRRRGYRDIGETSPEAFTKAVVEAGENDAARGLEMIEFLGWMIWNAGERNGLWATDFVTFSEKECASFAIIGGGDDAADPTAADSPER